MTVTLQAGDTTASAIASRINGTPGLASPASVSGGALRLDATTSIAVAGIDLATFAKIGLPNTSYRDRALTTSATIQPTVTITGEELDQISNVITVPTGANRITLWVSVLAVSQIEAGVDFALACGNSSSSSSPTTLFNVPFQAVLSGTVGNDSDNSVLGRRKGYVDVVQQVGSIEGLTVERMYAADIEPFVTKIWLVAFTANSETSNAAPPFTPPTMTARYGFGSR